MRSEKNEWTPMQLVTRKYLFKLLAYSGYFCGLILAQILASLMLAVVNTSSAGTNTPTLSIVLHTYTALMALIFSVLWAFIISFMLTTRRNKDISLSLPGSRLTDSLSDIGYILTGCLFGGITTALIGVALRIEMLLLHPGNVVASGFYPAFTDLCVIAAATFLYMLLASAVGYLIGTLIRFSKIFIGVIGAIVIFLYVSLISLTEIRSFWNAVGAFLFEQHALGLFALIVLVISAVFYGLGTVISHRLEVRKS